MYVYGWVSGGCLHASVCMQGEGNYIFGIQYNMLICCNQANAVISSSLNHL